MGYLKVPHSQEREMYQRTVHVSNIKLTNGGHAIVSRQKRNILFPSGVRLCAQETMQQVVANHLSYFHQRGRISI